MKKIVIAVMAIFAYALIADSAMAATVTGNLNVTTSVAASCRVTGTVGVAFAAYDPTDPAADPAGTGSFTFRCVKSTPYDLHIVRTNNMTGVPTPDLLAYTIYSDAGRTALWASSSVLPFDFTAGDNLPVTANIYGKIAALQNVAVGAYSETVTVTVTY